MLSSFNYLNILYVLIIIFVLVAVLIITYIINKKTKVPDDCPKESIGCSACMLNCNKREDNFSVGAYIDPEKAKKQLRKIEVVKVNKKISLEEQIEFTKELSSYLDNYLNKKNNIKKK